MLFTPINPMTDLIILYWDLLTALVVVGGVIGWWQLRERRQRVSLYLSRILLAVSLRNLLTFIGIFYWHETVRLVPIYVIGSAFAATLMCGAVWGWLFYLAGIWNGGGWRDLAQFLKGGNPMNNDKERVEDEENAPQPANPTTPPSGDGANADSGNDRDGVTDGPGK